MHCSLCDTPLRAFQVGSVNLDRCPKCAALWFDRTELAATLQHHAPATVAGWGVPARATSHSNPPRCPRDGTTRLHPYRWSAVNFWRCPDCRGVLLRAADWDTIVTAADTRPPLVTTGTAEGVGVLFEFILKLLD